MPARRPLIVLVLALAGWLSLGTGTASAQLDIGYACTPAPTTCDGWYTRDVAINWTLNPRIGEGTRIISGCSTPRFTTDTPGTWAWCEAQNGTNHQRVSKLIRLDKTAPIATGATPNRPPDFNGWYRQPVRVDFRGSDATSGIRSCTSVTYAHADSGRAAVQGTCQDVAGNTGVPLTFTLRYDATAPDITRARPSRKPDHGRWYTRPVTWRFEARDAVSGLAACPGVLHDGPPTATAIVTATCRDRAGNVGTRAVRFRYDAVPPARPSVVARPRDRAMRVRIGVAADVQRIVVRRSPGRRKSRRTTVYRGRPNSLTDRSVRNGRRYRYTVTAVDQAGNRTAGRVAAVPGPRLLSPAPEAALSAPPHLDWTRVRGARYYNVQLYRAGRKVLTAWPARSRLQLPQRWRFAGRSHRLAPGRYRWQVWPGFGPRRAADFGRRIGRRSFVIAEPAAPPARR